MYPQTFASKVFNMCQNYNTQLPIDLWMDKTMMYIENTEYLSTTIRNGVMICYNMGYILKIWGSVEE